MAGPRGAPPAVGIAMDDPPPEYSVAAHLPTYDQAELSKGRVPYRTFLADTRSRVPDPVGSGFKLPDWIRIRIRNPDPDPESEIEL